MDRRNKKAENMHRQRDQELKQAIQNLSDTMERRFSEVDEKLNPIFLTYDAWLHLGRWGKIVLYLAGAILGLLVAWKQIFKQ